MDYATKARQFFDSGKYNEAVREFQNALKLGI